MADTGTSNQAYQVLEQKWSKYIGTRYAVACSSGTTGLQLALAALGIGPGDEVIVPEFTMIATSWAVTYLGATPVFVDCRDDLNVWAEDIDKKITSRTKAIIVTHIYGRLVRDILLMGHWGIPVIEDACEAHGAEQVLSFPDRIGEVRRKAGSFGTMAVFSLYRNKIIQSEEGGLINVNDPGLYERMQDLKSMSFGISHDYYHSQIGYNYRLTNMQADVALRELGMIDKYLEDRQEFRKYLDQELNEFTLPRPNGSVVWVYDMVFKDFNTRHRVYTALAEAGMPVRLFFKPMSMQPMYGSIDEPSYFKLLAFDYSQRGLYIPYTPNVATLDKIIKLIKQNV